jgi:hypothetical protein
MHHELAKGEKTGGKTCFNMEEVGIDLTSVDEPEKQAVIPLASSAFL